MRIPEPLKEKWPAGVGWLGYNLLGMIPLWGFALIMLFFQRNPSWFEPFDHGQLFLYSTGFLAPSLYVLLKERKITQFPYRGQFTFVLIAALLVSGLLFTGITLASLSDAPDIVPRTAVLRYAGFGFFRSDAHRLPHSSVC